MKQNGQVFDKAAQQWVAAALWQSLTTLSVENGSR